MGHGRAPRWQDLAAQLDGAGVALGAPSLLFEPRAPEALRYKVPHQVQLLVEEGIEWLAWTWADEAGTPNPDSPRRRACLPGFIRLGDASHE